MNAVFVDTAYWIALANPREQWASAAKKAREKLGDVLLVTTDEVLIEFLNMLSKRGPKLREVATRMVREILSNPNIRTIQQSRDSFLKGLELYDQRADKDYSLVDCISMKTIRAECLREVLTSDNHFAQEGFTVPMRA